MIAGKFKQDKNPDEKFYQRFSKVLLVLVSHAGDPGSIPGMDRMDGPLCPWVYNNVFHIFGSPKPPTCKTTECILQNSLFRAKIIKCCTI